MSEPYPLKALLLLHDDALDAAKHAHAEALKSLETARLQTRGTQQAFDAHHLTTRAHATKPTSAAEAQTQSAWQERRREEAALLLRHLEDAQRTEQARLAEEAHAHLQLRKALGETQSTATHQEGWTANAQQAATTQEEFETEERR